MNSQSSIIWYKLTGKLYEQQRGKYFQLNSNLNVVKTSMQSPDLSRDAWTSIGSFNLFWGCLSKMSIERLQSFPGRPVDRRAFAVIGRLFCIDNNWTTWCTNSHYCLLLCVRAGVVRSHIALLHHLQHSDLNMFLFPKAKQ